MSDGETRMVDKETGESFPVFSGRMHYIKGYVPVSYGAPHSSLERGSTWIGMGLILASLAGFGTVLFGLGSQTVGSQDAWLTYVWLGAVIGVVLLAAGSFLVWRGRRYFRVYRSETGRSQ